MNWLKNLIFGSEAPAKQAAQPKEDLQARYLLDALAPLPSNTGKTCYTVTNRPLNKPSSVPYMTELLPE